MFTTTSRSIATTASLTVYGILYSSDGEFSNALKRSSYPSDLLRTWNLRVALRGLPGKYREDDSGLLHFFLADAVAKIDVGVASPDVVTIEILDHIEAGH